MHNNTIQNIKKEESIMRKAKVVKIGGSSLADAKKIQKAVRIIRKDSDRRYIIPSAPGRRFAEDSKITDLLIICYELKKQNLSFDEPWGIITERFEEIVTELQLELDISTFLVEIRCKIEDGTTLDYVASRGEFLNGKILAEALGFDFVDAKDIIFFDANGRFYEENTREALIKLSEKYEHVVIPGYYGSLPNGEIKTFSRGGSDITGAIVARDTCATLYENWTDVPGLSMVDPAIIPDAKPIRVISYEELEELADGGAQVLHQSAIFPARDTGIPINIRDINQPNDPGTLVVADASLERRPHQITGIAGRHFIVITVGKRGMNPEVGFVWKILGIMKDYGVAVQHFPGGNNTISLAIEKAHISSNKLEKVLNAIQRECKPQFLTVDEDVAIITIVGQNMINTQGIAATLFAGLASGNINVQLVAQGMSELTIIVGVKSDELEKAICAIYSAFINGTKKQI